MTMASKMAETMIVERFAVNQFGKAFTGEMNIIGLIAAIAVLAAIVYMLFKPYQEAKKLSARV